MTAREWIEKLELARHPEGGYFRETYRSRHDLNECCLGDVFEGRRSLSTAIYYLLPETEVSMLHRIKSDELWHHYAGSGLTIHVFEPGANYRTLALGGRPERGELPQRAVPAGCWFGATVNESDGFCLAGCTVSPGFSFEDFETADRAAMLERFPRHRRIIEKLT